MEIRDFRDINVRELAPGQKLWASLPVAGRADGQDYIIPVMIVKGSRPGPTLGVSGGVHGDEYEGPVAIRNMWHALDPAKLSGTYIGVPQVNVPAFEVGARANAVDHINLNRICPGRPNGFLTDRIAHAFFASICPQLDYVIDLHGGGLALDMAPVTIFRESADADFSKKTLDFAKACRTELLWKGANWPGTGGTISSEALKRGVPALTVELGGRGVLSMELARDFEQIIRNCLTHLGIIEGTCAPLSNYVKVEGAFIQSGSGGMFVPTAKLLERVKEGQVVGEIFDIWGVVREQIKAPHDGIIVSQRSFPTVQAGDWTVFVGKVIG